MCITDSFTVDDFQAGAVAQGLGPHNPAVFKGNVLAVPGLKIVNCEMIGTDLAFERSAVEATITTPVLSVKNPLSGHIYLPAVGEIIQDIEEAQGEVIVTER